MEQIFITVFIIFLILALIGLCMFVYVKFENLTISNSQTQLSNGNNFQQNQSLPAGGTTNPDLQLNRQYDTIPGVQRQQNNISIGTQQTRVLNMLSES